MNRQEKIGLHATRFLYAHLQRDKKIRVTGQHRAHVRLGIDARLEALGDLQRDIFLVGAALANRAGVFAAVARVQRDRHHAVNYRLAGFFGGLHLRRFRHRAGGFFCRLEILIQLQRFNGILTAFKQRHQRVGRIHRIHVEDQTMPIFTNRGQRKYLRRNPGFQLHDQAHHARFETPGTQQFDVGIVGRHLAGETVEHAVELDALDIDHEAVRIFNQKMRVFERRVVFEGNARVISRRPDAHRQHGGQFCRRAGQRRHGNDQ